VETCLKNEQIKDMNKPRHQRTLATITLVVPDYDEALAWYVNVMGFSLIEDTPLSDNKRWVIVSPGKGSNLLLAKAATSEQSAAIGNQTGGRVTFCLPMPPKPAKIAPKPSKMRGLQPYKAI